MLRAYLRGAAVATRHWLLVSAVFLVAGAFGLAFAFASGTFLTEALEGSLATRTLMKDFDPNVLVDLWYHHAEGLRMLVVVAVLLAIAHTMAWWWLHGLLIIAVQPEGDARGDRARGALEVTPTMALLFLIAVAMLAAWSAAIGLPAYALTRWTRSDPSPWVWYRVWGAAAVLWALGYVFLVAVHDHARIRACRTRSGALACYRWALGFVARGGDRAFGLALLLQVSAVAIVAAYQAISLTVPTTEVLGIPGSLAWGAFFLWLRIWVRLWFFAAQTELQS